MKQFAILLFLALLFNSAQAQFSRKWFQLNGPNTGNHNAQLLFGPKGEIISVGIMGYYQTTDDGVTWAEHRIIPAIHCNLGYYYSFNSGLFISSNGEYYFYLGTCDTSDNGVMGVYRSTDQGITWKHILIGKYVSNLVQLPGGTLILNADNLYESIDNGNSWTTILQGGISKICGITDHYIFSTNQYDVSRLSLQGGGNQQFMNVVQRGSRNIFVNQIGKNVLMLSDDEFYGNGYQRKIYITTDGENQWDSTSFLAGAVAFSGGPGDTIYAVTENPDNSLSIFFSTNLGKDWTKFSDIKVLVPTPNTDQIINWSINCANPNAILFENDTAFYLSRDRGNSWKQIGLPFDSVKEIVVTKDNRIFTERPVNIGRFFTANGGYYDGNIYLAEYSSDNGKNWYKTVPRISPEIFSTYASSQGISSFGKGPNGGVIAIAPDSNESWNSAWTFDPSAPTQWVKRSAFQDIPDHPLIASDNQRIYVSSQATFSNPFLYRSDDTAFTWNALAAPNDGESIYSLDVSSDGTVYYGTYPAMYRSDDQGVSWVKLLPTRQIVQLSAIKAFGTTGVLLGTSGAGLLQSTDKGISWNRIDGNNFDSVTCVGIDSRGSIAAGTNRGLWFFDVDTHQWAKVVLGANEDLYIGSIDVAPNDDFYIGTYGASVWQGTTHRSVINGVPSRSAASPLGIFPNPAADKITVKYDSHDNGKIEIYDMLGRKVFEHIAGEAAISIQDIPNGVYSLTVTAGTMCSVQKLVIQH